MSRALILLLLLSSCVTQKRCLERYPPQNITKDSIIIREVTVYRDTIITVRLPGDTVMVEQDLDSLMAPLISENKYAKAIAEVYKNKLRVTLIQKESEISFKLDSAYKQTLYWKERWETDKQTIVNEVRYTPGIYKIALGGWIGIIFLLVLFILYKVFKPF